MKIAFYDDDINHKRILEELLYEYSFSRNTDYSIVSFSSADDLLNKDFNYQILLLDILLENQINGINLGIQLRERGYQGIIILITSAKEFAIQGYEAEAFRFITKPINSQTLFPILDAAIKKLKCQSTLLKITFNSENILIDSQKIVYIESLKRTRYIHTIDNQVFESKETISDLQKKLPKSHFSSPHKSYVVNLEYISKSSFSEILLSNKTKIPISRSHHDDFVKELYSYITARSVKQ